jgi:hypothetical protein
VKIAPIGATAADRVRRAAMVASAVLAVREEIAHPANVVDPGVPGLKAAVVNFPARAVILTVVKDVSPAAKRRRRCRR